MSIETDVDRLELLKALGETVDVDGRRVCGIFERTFNEISFDTAVEGLRPQVTVRDIDVEGIQRGAPVVHNKVNYAVATIEPDGTGLTVLRLNER
jgi:hypothetical protein